MDDNILMELSVQCLNREGLCFFGRGRGKGGEISVVQSGDSHYSCVVTGTHILENSYMCLCG